LRFDSAHFLAQSGGDLHANHGALLDEILPFLRRFRVRIPIWRERRGDQRLHGGTCGIGYRKHAGRKLAASIERTAGGDRKRGRDDQ